MLYNEIVFCPDDYLEYNQYSKQEEINEAQMYEDIATLMRIIMKCNYQMRIYNDGYSTVIQFDYLDPAMSYATLEWVQQPDADEENREVERDSKEDSKCMAIKVTKKDFQYSINTTFKDIKDTITNGGGVILITEYGDYLSPYEIEEDFITFVNKATNMAYRIDDFGVLSYEYTKKS